MRASKIEATWARKKGDEVIKWRPVVTVDAIPSPLRNYTAVKATSGHTYFFTEEEGYVNYNVHDPKNEDGYGGRPFSYFVKRFLKVNLETSEVYEDWRLDDNGSNTGWWVVNGPWSSRSGVMNMLSHELEELGWPMSMEASIFDESKGYAVGGAVTISWLFGEIQRLGAPYEIIPDPLFMVGEEIEPQWEIRPKEVTADANADNVI